jgi:hypothetical protein
VTAAAASPRSFTMNQTSLTAMRDVLADLGPEKTQVMFAYMQFFEPDTFAAAVAYVTRPAVQR